MDSFGSGDKTEPAPDVPNDDEKPKKENDHILQTNEECGDKNYVEVVIENVSNDKHNEDNIVLPMKDNCEVCPNECSNILGSSRIGNYESIQINEVCGNVTSDQSMPDITDRITECKNIIASLKIELNNERSKLEQEFQCLKPEPEIDVSCKASNSNNYLADLSYPTNFFTASVDTMLHSDRNLIEYEKQLQRYQRTLNMAQNAKKNAIRKQMLAKAFKLKLLEVENQCNIELLRVKQNLQCLEPLKMIAETWKTEKDVCDLSKYDLIPLFPEIYLNAGSDSISADSSDLDPTKN